MTIEIGPHLFLTLVVATVLAWTVAMAKIGKK
jgi:hypothetical protein